MNRRILVLVLIFLGLLCSGCRYEEPAFSLKTPENRLVGIWLLKTAEKNGTAYNGTDYEPAILNTLYHFHYEGPLEVKVTSILVSGNAFWEFADKYRKLKIYIDMPRRTYHFTANITRLSNGELKFNYDDGEGNHWKLEFAKQSNSF